MQHMIGWALSALGLFGLLTSTVFLGLVLVGIARFRRQAREQMAACYATGAEPYLPPVSLLKPLHGPEPGLENNLRGFFNQKYEVDGKPQYEILFCARDATDAGLAVARRLALEYPAVPVKFLSSGEPSAPNAKVCSLEVMAAAAAHAIWVISDSDVRVGREYLREVVSPFRDGKVGGVTCLYRGVADEGGLWARLEATGMSVEMSSGVVIANWMEGIRFMLGPTMAVRRECVEEMGGMGVLRDYCADDFVLGDRIANNGHTIVLSGHCIEHVVLNHGLLDSIRHQARWMKSTRFSRPKGHFGTVLTFAMPFGVLAMAGFSLLDRWEIGALLLGFAIAGRMLQALLVGGLVVREKNLWSTVLLFPLRDFMGAIYWAMSYSSRRILWRGEIYLLEAQGRMKPVRQGLGARD
jgi:ceramide glucosyltransferase